MIYNVECKIQMVASSMEECLQRIKAIKSPQNWLFDIKIREYKNKDEALCNNTLYKEDYHVSIKDSHDL